MIRTILPALSAASSVARGAWRHDRRSILQGVLCNTISATLLLLYAWTDLWPRGPCYFFAGFSACAFCWATLDVVERELRRRIVTQQTARDVKKYIKNLEDDEDAV